MSGSHLDDRGLTNRVQALVDQDPTVVHLLDSNSSTPLHHAAYRGHVDCARILIDNGALVDASDKDKCTPLHNASYMGKLDMISFLIEKGANVDHKDIDRSTPLHKASFAGHLECARLLIHSNCSIDESDNEGITALQKATYNDHNQTLSFLIEKGADISAVDLKGSTALHKAAFNGNLPCVKILLGKGADVNIRDNEGTTPLHNAVYSGHVEVVSTLLESSCDPNSSTTKNHSTSLHFAAFNGYLDCIKLLLDKGADIDPLDIKKMTPLHYAVKREHEDCLQHLIERGADLNAKDYKGRSWSQMTTNQKILRICKGDAHASHRRDIRTSPSTRNLLSVTDVFGPAATASPRSPSGGSTNGEGRTYSRSGEYGKTFIRLSADPYSCSLTRKQFERDEIRSPRSVSVSSPASVSTTEEQDIELYGRLDRNGFLMTDEQEASNSEMDTKGEVTRAMKWLKLVQNWDTEYKRNSKKIRTRCEKGIPARVRNLAWLLLAKASPEQLRARNPTYYQELLAEESSFEDQIGKDITRTFPRNIFLMQGTGRQSLTNVLKALSIHNKEVGYCQGMGFVCGLLLMYMSEEDSFWVLTQLEVEYEMGHLWRNPAEGARRMAFMLALLLESQSNRIYQHVAQMKIELDLNMVTMAWLLPGWLTSLPFSLTLRIWDIFLFEGISFMLAVCLSLFKYFERETFSIMFGSRHQPTSSSSSAVPFLKFDDGNRSGPAGKIDVEALLKTANSYKDRIKQKYKDMDRAYQRALERNELSGLPCHTLCYRQQQRVTGRAHKGHLKYIVPATTLAGRTAPNSNQHSNTDMEISKLLCAADDSHTSTFVSEQQPKFSFTIDPSTFFSSMDALDAGRRRKSVPKKKVNQVQREILEGIFTQNNYPSSSLQNKLAEQLFMTPRRVQRWFQNRRAKDRNTPDRSPSSSDSSPRSSPTSFCDSTPNSPPSLSSMGPMANLLAAMTSHANREQQIASAVEADYISIEDSSQPSQNKRFPSWDTHTAAPHER
ncbi:ankyrin repeat-containing protein [Planoprotostelium fungivorum]|uniref:Ankyrin repeat-containing protein n=1 Tax=Planoprotostelium fungivorum TaxID=1890364 RepID=A0A2P6NJE5_9EUKA|nr:ankyrin repeat-containing protein [Planoprotostelium fungivorum]